MEIFHIHSYLYIMNSIVAGNHKTKNSIEWENLFFTNSSAVLHTKGISNKSELADFRKIDILN